MSRQAPGLKGYVTVWGEKGKDYVTGSRSSSPFSPFQFVSDNLDNDKSCFIFHELHVFSCERTIQYR